MSLVKWMDKHLYSGYQRNWDDSLLRARILAVLKPNAKILDLGAGAGIVTEMNFLGLAGKVCGIDLDPRVTTNPLLNEGRVANVSSIPYPDLAFDLVFADNVIEHLEDPLKVFREVFRVLKQGGIFLFKTPNELHYMPAIARITPHTFHKFINKLRGRADIDTFPTLYKANNPHMIRNLAQQCGFNVNNIVLVEGRPEYLRLSSVTYLIGYLYERLVNSTMILANFRILLIAELQKPSEILKE